ncbi:MAG: radical SAM family heme chaperone HemW [Actinomycetia bacterium]|nr:radical SAM family heme chaperone HemW [Actinomycetes bacterium]
MSRGGGGGARHLYVHLPFCAHRCGYCDFVTVVGRRGQHAAYVDALLAELELERDLLDEPLDTVYLGGGTPSFTAQTDLIRLLRALPKAAEVTVEANPETVTPAMAPALRDAGVTRISLGAQTFAPNLLSVLERRTGPDRVRAAVRTLRDEGFANLSLDLVFGIPGQTPADLASDLAAAVALEPEHLSCYELEAKPGTRFTVAHGAELARQAEAIESYYEQVVVELESCGYRWYETANFCRSATGSGLDLRSAHNLAYWEGRDCVGLGIGAVSTVGLVRWRNEPSLPRYLAVAAGASPAREHERLTSLTRARERLMLGLRLDVPVSLRELDRAIDSAGLERVRELGLVELEGGMLTLARRGRFIANAVSAELVCEEDPGPCADRAAMAIAHEL